MPKLIFKYKYGHGGYGDMLKGIVSTKCLAAFLGVPFGIDLSEHPISQVVRIPDGMRARAGHVTDIVDFELWPPRKEVLINIITKRQPVVGDMGLLINYHVRDILSEYWPNSREESDRTWRTFYSAIFIEPDRPTGLDYDVVQCRQGDKYAYEGNKDDRCSIEIARQELSKWSFDKNRLHFVTGDTPDACRLLMDMVPNAFGMCQTPRHTAMPDVRGIVDVRKTIVEHLWLCGAKKITMLSFSNFCVSAARISGAPVYMLRGGKLARYDTTTDYWEK